MKKYITIIALTTITVNVFAQKIGINTDIPAAGTTFHIDAAGNTSNGAGTADDVVVTSAGQLGIGTTTPLPDSKVEINGSFRMRNGAGEERVLMSDEQGNASWQTFALGDFASIFRIDFADSLMELGKIYTGAGNARFLSNDLDLTTDGFSILTIPKGRYLLMLVSNIKTINEYGKVSLWNETENLETFNIIYGIYQSGASIYIDLEKETTFSIKFTPIDAHSKGLSYVEPLPYHDITGFFQLDVVRIQGFFTEKKAVI
ncbi:MAG: hypothetical protein LBT29_08380 [Flavobacteriaceae bacterium]|jgi:hypothetical protein|nr:hypothetical protein [Flavobacteriaceae bacterium]